MFTVAFALALAASAPAGPKPIMPNATPYPPVETAERAAIHREERKQLAEQCQKGLPGYCYYLGRWMKLGLGGPADPKGARAFFDYACRGHVTDACIELDPHYIDADVRKTAELGCRNGDQSFCMRLAKMLKVGVGGPRDPDRAKSLLQTACRKGYERACAAAER